MVSTASLEDTESQQMGSVELWNLSEHVLVSDVLRQALFGAAKFGMRQGITIPQEDPKSPFLMASSHHVHPRPKGLQFQCWIWMVKWIGVFDR